MMRAMPRSPARSRARRHWPRLRRPLLSLAVLAGGLLLAAAFVGITAQGNAVAREAEAIKAQIEAELQRHAALSAAVAERGTEAYIVDRARDFGYVRPGEGIIAVEKAPSGAAAAESGPVRPTRLQRWWDLFFGPR